MFLSFEGLDGSGKTTQAKLLQEKLVAEQYTVQFLREPGGTEISERIRDILLDKKHLGMTEIAELLLFSSARTQLVTQVIQPALEKQTIVLCDRFVDSTTAYQGYGRGLQLDAVKTINAFATCGVLPHKTFFIDIPVDEMYRRRTANNLSVDRMEMSSKEFYERVRNGYHAIAKEEPHRFIIINGMQNVETIHQEIYLHVRAVLLQLHTHGT